MEWQPIGNAGIEILDQQEKLVGSFRIWLSVPKGEDPEGFGTDWRPLPEPPQ